MDNITHLHEFANRQVDFLTRAINEVQQERAQLHKVHESLVQRRMMWAERIGQLTLPEPIDYQPPLFEMGEL